MTNIHETYDLTDTDRLVSTDFVRESIGADSELVSKCLDGKNAIPQSTALLLARRTADLHGYQDDAFKGLTLPDGSKAGPKELAAGAGTSLYHADETVAQITNELYLQNAHAGREAFGQGISN